MNKNLNLPPEAISLIKRLVEQVAADDPDHWGTTDEIIEKIAFECDVALDPNN